MNTRDNNDAMYPTVSDAVETLSSIAEMDFDRDLSMANNDMESDIITQGEQSSPISRRVSWLYEMDPESRVENVKEIFKVILHYLRSFYKKEFRYMANQKETEGIKAIMVIVGEAAKKLDQHREFFENSKLKSVTDLPEYKRLQDFYLSRIATKIDESVLSKWIIGLSQRLLEPVETTPKTISPIKHVFVDLESVKKDTEYELFFIRKEDGSRFFSPRLIRNMKLVCDFGNRLNELKKDDPLDSIYIWRDHICQASAKNILQSIPTFIHRFYNEASSMPEGELRSCLGKALMALMLCSNAHHVTIDSTIKSCTDYFVDFQDFLRQALYTRDYQKFIAYPPAKSDKQAHCLIDLTQALCRAFFVNMTGYNAILPNILNVMQEAQLEKNTNARPVEDQVWSHLHSDYQALTKLLKRHASGPLVKVLEILEEGNYHAFDPLQQDNIPSVLYKLYTEDKEISNVRIPSPVHQEFIHKAQITEEFKSFLRSLVGGTAHKRYLIINFQDRTSWREHTRSIAIEELQKHSDFSKQLCVVTLPKDTEFYHQTAPYHNDNKAEIFFKHFKEHLKDEASGFYFPAAIKKALFPDFIDGMMHAIHRVFFRERNVIPLERRLDFIEIFYLFLELKIIELVNPDAFSLLCKDGVDTGPAASALLFVFLKWLQAEKLSKTDFEELALMLHAPAIMIRERTMLVDRFNRLEGALKEIELIRSESGWADFTQMIQESFGSYYKSDILKRKLLP